MIRSDPESRANHKDPEPSGENRSGTAGTRSDHPRLNRLLGAESNCRSDRTGGCTQGKVRPQASRRSLHRASSQPLCAAFSPARACVSCRYRCFSQPLAIVLISYHPDAARGAPHSFGSRLLFLSIRCWQEAAKRCLPAASPARCVSASRLPARRRSAISG